MEEGVVINASRAEVEVQLQRILRDPEFERNRSASNFLRFVVDETLEGRGPRLKAFTIALAVFGRDANFDPQNNSIVRVQAARLRQLLHSYYSGPGADDPIRIQMPIGKYLVQFDESSVPAAPAEPEAEPESRIEPEPPAPLPAMIDDESAAPVVAARPSGFVWPERQLIFAGLAAAVAILGLILFLRPYAASSPDALQAASTLRTPILTIVKAEGSRVPDDVSAFTANLLDSIESGLAAFDNIVVRQSSVAGRKASLVTYSLTIKSAASPDGDVRLGFRLVHGPTGEFVWSKDISDVAMTDSSRQAIGDSVAHEVGDAYGAIMIDSLKRTNPWPEKPRGHLCILSAFDYLKDRTEAKRGRAHDCLEAEIIADPQNSAALTMLSAFLVHDYLDATPGGNGEEDLSRATRLAQRAITYDPQRARPNYTLFLTGFYDKRFDEAFLAAHRALELNPNAGIFSTQLGASYISRGEYEKGEALFRNAEKRGWTPPGILNAFFALAAYMRGDEMRIRDFARRASAADGSIGLLLKIAVCHQYHDADGAARAYELLLQKFPGVATDVPAALDRYAFSDKIKEKLLSDLHQAGYAIANQTFPVAH